MLPLGNKPLLEYLVEWLQETKQIDEVILCVSYLHRSIEDYFEDGSRFGIKIKYSRSDRPLATAGQLKTASKFIDEPFVCLYGDSVYEFPLNEMIDNHQKDKAFISMALRSEEHTSELQSRRDLVCRLLLEKKNNIKLKFIPHYRN